MNLLTLIGDIDENFYQLGLQDKQTAKDVHRDVKLMLSTPWRPVNLVIEEIAKNILKNSLLKNSEYYTHLKSYSEGLGIDVSEAAYVMLIPEIVSCMTKWAPGLIKGNLGCSSFFMRNGEGDVVHGRILDFPLQGSYDLHERGILYDLNGMPKTFGFGSAGIPYPSITLMTEEGMTLALHQKFTNVFNKDGLSIFELIFKMIKNCGDKKSVIEFLHSHESITTWSLYMSFKNGDVIATDLMGKDPYVNELSVPDTGILYFCNHLENKELKQEEMLPTGFHEYNKMREEMAGKKIKQFLEKNNRSDADLLRMMTTPHEQKMKVRGHYEHYQMDNVTPSSLSAMTLNPTRGTAHYVTGEAPKLFRDNLIVILDCFNNPVSAPVKTKKNHKTVSEDYYLGLHSLMKAQKGFDLHDPQIIYHELQFSFDHLEDHVEKVIPEFYFLVAQYIYETHPKVLMNILSEFKRLEGHLPKNLNDHCLLFVGRLERILNAPFTVEEDKIQHPKLKKIFDLEQKIPRSVLHLSTKGMIVPRMDILDIIYAYTL